MFVNACSRCSRSHSVFAIVSDVIVLAGVFHIFSCHAFAVFAFACVHLRTCLRSHYVRIRVFSVCMYLPLAVFVFALLVFVLTLVFTYSGSTSNSVHIHSRANSYYIYIYIYKCVCIHILSIYIYIYIYLYMHLYTYVCMYVCMRDMCIYMCTSVYSTPVH